MRNLFIQFMVILFLGIVFVGCTSESSTCKTNSDCKDDKICIDKKCEANDIQSGLFFESIADKDFIDGYRYDEDSVKSGVQTTIHASGKDFEDGTDITLMVEGDEASKVTEKLKVLEDGTSAVTFKEFTLQDGESKLILSATNQYGKFVTSEIMVTAKELEIEIKSPLADLTEDDDQDTQRVYVQADVKADVKGLAIEGLVSVKLSVIKIEADTESIYSLITASPKDGQVVFENVDFPNGNWKIIASIDTLNNTTVSSLPVLLKAEFSGACTLTVTPETGTLINQAYLLTDPAEGRNITIKATTEECPAGYQARLTVNPDDAETPIVVMKELVEGQGEDLGKRVVVFTQELPEDVDHGGDASEIKIELSNDFANDKVVGISGNTTYNVDTVGPELMVSFPSINYELFEANDADNDLSNGMQFAVKGTTVDTDPSKALAIAVDDGEYKEFVGAIDETTLSFDTSLLDDAKYVSISTSGSHTLKFKAYDSHENETIVEVPVTVYLGDITLAITDIATKSITSEIETNGLKLNKADDLDANTNNMQFVINASVSGLDIGRVMGLYLDDNKILESSIEEDLSSENSEKISFNLNTESLGLADGEYNLYVKTLENNGPKSKTIKLFVSNTKPVLSLSNFRDGDYTNQSPITLNIATSGLSGDQEQVNLSVNGNALTPVTVDDQGFAVFSNLDLTEGSNTFEVTASDYEGNTADSLNFTINYDSQNPNIAITAPLDGAQITRALDSNLSLAGVQVVVNADVDNEIDGTEAKLLLGTTEVSTTTVVDNKVSFTDITLQSSVENILKIVVTDKAGNTSDSQISVTVDDGCYDLQFLSPTLQNAKLNDSSFIGTVNVGPVGSSNSAPDNLALVLKLGSDTFNSTISSGGNSSFSGVSLSQGDNTLVLSYNVDASTYCEASVIVNYDTAAPTITALSITDKDSMAHSFSSEASANLGLVYDTSVEAGLQANIKLDISDIEANQKVQLSVDSGDVIESNVECDANGSNCFAIFNPLTLLEGGPYSLLFNVEDVNGNKSNDYSLTLNVDLTKPTVAFDSDFPLSLNTSNSVDQQPSIDGIQYSVIADLTNIQAGDTVKFYIDGNLAKMRLNSALSTEVDAEYVFSGGETNYTFENVTFPLNNKDVNDEPIPYEIKLVVYDASGNQTEDIKANYKVLDELVLTFLLSDYTTRSKYKINSTERDITLKLTRQEIGVMSLTVYNELTPSTIINTLTNNMDGSSFNSVFTLTDTSEIMNDGRYLLYPKFKDESNFEYETTSEGYLAVKRSTPTISSFNIVQDLDLNNILNKSEDADLLTAGFQSSVEVSLSNVYLDADDCSENPIVLILKKSNSNGVELGRANVACDGSVSINATFPEDIGYIIYASLEDNFGNSLAVNNQGTITVDITAPMIGNVVAASKSFADNIKFLAIEDANSSLAGFQSNLTVSTSGNANTVKVETSPAGLSDVKTPVSDSTDFGTVTINDGVYDFTVTATDEAGNSTQITYTNIVVDTLIPSLNLSMSKTTANDSDDENSSEIGIQLTATIDNMLNIETGRTIYIQKSDDGVNWTNFSSFVKDANNSKVLELTVPTGTYKLRAYATDQNSQEGKSASVDMSITSSNCSIINVKKGTLELGAGDNYFNDTDVVGGNVSLTISLASSCGGYTLTSKKAGVISSSLVISSTSESMNIPFSDGDNLSLSFEVDSTPNALVSYSVIVDTVAPIVTRVNPTNETVSYVNIDNPSINGTSIIGDLSTDADAQVTLSVHLDNENGGTIEMISNDGNSNTNHETKSITSDNFDAVFTGQTIATNKTHDVSFKVTDIAGNTSTTSLYTATVDVMNPGNLSVLSYDGMSDTERRKAELNLTWNQSLSGDDGSNGNIVKYVIKYSSISFAQADFETLTGHQEITINNPDMATATYQNLVQSLVFNKVYTIAVRAYDELGNASNILLTTTTTDLNLATGGTDTALADSVVTNFKNVGDINDDGYDDFVVGQDSYGAAFKGRATIYYGTPDPADLGSNTQVLEDAFNYEQYGTCIAGGDFNGDGLQDLMIGTMYANWFSCSAADDCYEGGVKIYYNQGSGTDIDTADVTNIRDGFLTNNEAALSVDYSWKSGKFGDTCNLLGDLDGDGTDDFIIGETNSLYTNDGATQKGRAFIVKGRLNQKPATIDVDADANSITLEHNTGDAGSFASSIAGVGDLDNDGAIDVVIGDKTNQKAYVYYLATNSSGLIDTLDANVVTLTGSNSLFSKDIVSNIDLDNDGINDLVVGSDGSGRVKVFYGGARFTNTKTEDASFYSGSTFGARIDAGDFNGDGKDDLIIAGKDFVDIFLSKTARYTGNTNPYDVRLERTVDSLGATESTLWPIAFSVNDDNNDTNFDSSDIEDFVIMNLEDKDLFIKY